MIVALLVLLICVLRLQYFSIIIIFSCTADEILAQDKISYLTPVIFPRLSHVGSTFFFCFESHVHVGLLSCQNNIFI